MTSDTAPKDDQEIDIPLRRNRDFQLLWMGGVTSGLGKEFTQIAFPLLLLAITGSAGYAGFLASAHLATYALIMLPAGVLADRFNRSYIMAFSTFFNALLLAILTLLMLFDAVHVATLFTIAVLMAMLEGLFAPTQDASLKQIVSVDHLNDAYAIDQARSQAAGLVGPVIGGWLFTLGRWVPFLGSFLAFLASGIFIRTIKRPLQSERIKGKQANIGWRGALEGFRFIFRNPLLRLITLISMGMMFTLAAFPLIYIASLHAAHVSATLIGFMIAAYGVAGVLGALATPRILRVIPPNVMIIIGTWLLPLVMASLAFTSYIPVVVGCACILFFSMPPLTSIARGYLAAIAPSHLQGRVFASTMIIGAILTPIAPTLFGIVFDSAGRSWAFIGMTIAGVLSAIPSAAKPIRTAKRIERMATTRESS